MQIFYKRVAASAEVNKSTYLVLIINILAVGNWRKYHIHLRYCSGWRIMELRHLVTCIKDDTSIGDSKIDATTIRAKRNISIPLQNHFHFIQLGTIIASNVVDLLRKEQAPLIPSLVREREEETKEARAAEEALVLLLSWKERRMGGGEMVRWKQDNNNYSAGGCLVAMESAKEE
ncbi:unnamed protein product [Lactuca saligna]|uniref:Uncharacterized protein n=1 Tax=Lactuca saligna TaxID=75948 RepID=A0AA35ZN90_LACSI|nr:unnamed protein product [Lactuca saligna]